MNEETVTIIDLADDLGLRKQTVFKVATRLGIELSSRREPSRRNQIVSTITASEAAALERSEQFFQMMPKVGEYDDETDVENDDVL